MGKNTRNICYKTLFILVVLIVCAVFFLSPGALNASSEAAEISNQSDVRILVAYYSLTGNTKELAEGVVAGAERVDGAEVMLKDVNDVTKEDLEVADGIILGAPTYFANIPGTMKTIIDDWNWKMGVDFTDKVGGAFATAGGLAGGQEHVVVSLLMFMINNRMVVAGPLYENETTGSIWAVLGATANTGPLDPEMSEGELDCAARLGERVATLAIKMNR